MSTIDLNSNFAKKIIDKTKKLLGDTWKHDISEVTSIEISKNYYDIYINNKLSASTNINTIQ